VVVPMKLHDLSLDQRPRERLFSGFGEHLSDAEVLALIWGSGVKGRSAVELGQTLLTACGGLHGFLGLGLADWARFPGIGPARAGQVWASLELARRARRRQEAPRLNSPRAAGDYLLPRSHGWTEERFGLLALNARGVLIADRILSHGLSNATLISPSLLVPNHPAFVCE
jgi:DNA repair protein RadC